MQPQPRSPRRRGRRPRRTGEGIPSAGTILNLELLISSLLQHCKHGGVLVIADGGNLAVVRLEVRNGRKEGRDAVCRVVLHFLLEVELAACTKGIMTTELE